MTEEEIENLAIEIFQKQNFTFYNGKDIAPDSTNPLRNNFDEVILESVLKENIAKINPNIPNNAQIDALNQVLRISSSSLIDANEKFHKMLTEGVKIHYQKNGIERGDLVWLVDFNNIKNNDFYVVNQFTVTYENQNKRPDIVLFVNGLPLVVIELKNAISEQATIGSAYKQLETYKDTIPSLFIYNGILAISDGFEARAGSISSLLNRFMSWRVQGKEKQEIELEILIEKMLNKQTLLDLIRHFTVFEKSSSIDSKTQITSVKIIKKIAAYHQYYAVNKAVLSVEKATNGSRKGGVVWHTQGSGKSLSMVFTTGKLVLKLNNPTILVITDRNDLDEQLFDSFASSKQLLRQTPVKARDRKDLKKLLKVASGGVVFTTIQKFSVSDGNIYEALSMRENIVVIVDEAHRTQYGFGAKTVDSKDEAGNLIGKKTVYGFAKYMRDALPNATYLGFTGTPIENTDKNTPAVFGEYVDIYDISQAVKDGATVKIYYESRLAKIDLDDKGKKLVKELDKDLEKQDLSESQKAKAKWTQLEALIGSEKTIKKIAKDIIDHFEKRQNIIDGKGMIVAMSRRIAAALYEKIIKLKPDWHNEDLSKGAIKVVMTSKSSDGPEMARHHTSKEQRRILADRIKNPQDELQLVIVRNMWLTGFDAPAMHTLYIHKPMQGHNLMQAIARVNRVYKDKKGGLVVDYFGIASDLKKALSFYADNGGKGEPAIAQKEAVQMMLEELEIIQQMFHDFDYQKYFNSSVREKLAIILAAENHILGLDNGKKRFIDIVARLSQIFAIAVPDEKAMKQKEEVAFFQAIKARLCKFEHSASGKSDEAIETAIRQVIDEALVTHQVIDVFDAAGIKKPDISILSEEFLLEIKGMKHKNIALETLKKILHDEIKTRTKKNLIESQTLMKMLEDSIKRYHNKILTAAEVIDELINLGKEIKKMDKSSKEMGLTDFEYAFYTAIASNDSATELMQKDKLRELAVVLTEKIKNNASIDWQIKESVRANLRVIVKRTLRKFGYPPDMEKLATETVLKQAELMATEIIA